MGRGDLYSDENCFLTPFATELNLLFYVSADAVVGQYIEIGQKIEDS